MNKTDTGNKTISLGISSSKKVVIEDNLRTYSKYNCIRPDALK